MIFRRAMLVLTMAMAFTAAQARLPNVPMLSPERVVLKRMDGQPSTPEQMRKAILTGTQPFGWKLLSDDPGTLKLEFVKRDGPSAIVRIDYDAQSYQINYVSSYMLSHEAGAGGTTIHPTYNIWMKNLLMRIMLPGELVPASAVSAALAASR